MASLHENDKHRFFSVAFFCNIALIKSTLNQNYFFEDILLCLEPRNIHKQCVFEDILVCLEQPNIH